jgi:zinc transporter, ZIP family
LARAWPPASRPGSARCPSCSSANVSARLQNTLLGFAAGVMLSASFFSLILPGLAYAEADLGSRTGAVLVGFGGRTPGRRPSLVWLNRRVPHEHFILGPSGGDPKTLRRIWLFVIAITLHNVPEGLAVGVGFGSGDVSKATTLAIGIGLQNVPEGLAVATALVSQKYSRLSAAAIGPPRAWSSRSAGFSASRRSGCSARCCPGRWASQRAR